MAQTPGSTFTPGSPSALAYLTQLLRQKNVDPEAAGAVFSVEGAGGGIGDGGHAFGPGQFNDAGGVWTGRYQGLSPEQKNEQAWSQPGLQELAQRVAAVAAGLHGQDAITNIVRRFERPADPAGEITRASAAYGSPHAGVSAPTPLAAAAAPSVAAPQSPRLALAAAPRPAPATPLFGQALRLLGF